MTVTLMRMNKIYRNVLFFRERQGVGYKKTEKTKQKQETKYKTSQVYDSCKVIASCWLVVLLFLIQTVGGLLAPETLSAPHT